MSVSIAQNSWLGTKAELTSLCAKAEEYGIKIICDIVVNHLANDGKGTTGLSTEVATYEPTIYNNYNQYIHEYVSCSDSSIREVVRGNIGMPDLNTANSYVQERVISLLKECIDCGVDGFRFDAAKHIETSSDGQYASNFWSNVIGTAKSYARSTKGIELYTYGEILNTPGEGRSYSAYTSLMSVTDNLAGNNVRNSVNNGSASGAASSYYNTGQSANKLVLWAESHDTYEDNSSKYVSMTNINKAWAMVGSRADATALYFVRPFCAMMCSCGSSVFKSSFLAAVNLFHNQFILTNVYLIHSVSLSFNYRFFTF